jgi:hypothetical protein
VFHSASTSATPVDTPHIQANHDWGTSVSQHLTTASPVDKPHIQASHVWGISVSQCLNNSNSSGYSSKHLTLTDHKAKETLMSQNTLQQQQHQNRRTASEEPRSQIDWYFYRHITRPSRVEPIMRPEFEGRKFLRNVGWFSVDCKPLIARAYHSSYSILFASDRHRPVLQATFILILSFHLGLCCLRFQTLLTTDFSSVTSLLLKLITQLKSIF